MSQIVPTVTAKDPHTYRTQVERIAGFARRIHLDFSDEEFTSVNLIDIEKAWRPENIMIDVHLMFKNPADKLHQTIKLKPDLVILQAESDGRFNDLAQTLKEAGIKVGVALLPETSVIVIQPVLNLIDHVLIFSGHLGHYGGKANLSLLGKVSEIKDVKPEIEIGWDGGVNDQNARTLSVNGVDVLNVGGFIQHAAKPEEAYAKLESVIK